jgi:hypothetical protein
MHFLTHFFFSFTTLQSGLVSFFTDGRALKARHPAQNSKGYKTFSGNRLPVLSNRQTASLGQLI